MMDDIKKKANEEKERMYNLERELRNEIYDLNKKNDQLNIKNEALDHELIKLKSIIAGLESDLEKEIVKKKHFEEKIVKLNAVQRDTAEGRRRARNDLYEVEAVKQEQHTQIINLKSKLDKTSNTLADTEKELRNLQRSYEFIDVRHNEAQE